MLVGEYLPKSKGRIGMIFPGFRGLSARYSFVRNAGDISWFDIVPSIYTTQTDCNDFVQDAISLNRKMASYKLTDLFFVYQFIRRLTTPYKRWPAFEAGVIDNDGNVLVPQKERTKDQSKAFGASDLMILRLKRLLAKIPGGKSQIATYAAALMLLQESKKDGGGTLLKETKEFLESYRKYIVLFENAPTNTVGGGAVAGLGYNGPDDLLVKRKRKCKRKSRNT